MADNQKPRSCPKHGTKYMIKEGASYYCGAPTPGEISNKCFYHPNHTRNSERKYYKEKKAQEDADNVIPNVMEVLAKEWDGYKKIRRKQLEKQRAEAEEKETEREAKKNSPVFY